MKKIINFVGCGHEVNAFLPDTKEHIKVSGHKGTWYIIETKWYDNVKKYLYLCEHEQYGDETACVIIDGQYNLIMDDIWNGFDDYEEEIQWEQYKKDYMSVQVTRERQISEDTWLIRGKFEKVSYDVIVMIINALPVIDGFSFFYEERAPKDKATFEKEVKKYFASKLNNL